MPIPRDISEALHHLGIRQAVSGSFIRDNRNRECFDAKDKDGNSVVLLMRDGHRWRRWK